MRMRQDRRAQIALEFIVVYSIVLIIFVVVFALVANQRATSLATQQGSFLQILTRDVASQIDIALASGNGYAATVSLPASISSTPYALYLSSAGTVVANLSIGSQVLGAQSSSFARNLVINGTAVFSSGQVTLYRLLSVSGMLHVYNYLGTVYVNAQPPSSSGMLGSVAVNYTYGNQINLNIHAASMTGGPFIGGKVGVVAIQGGSANAVMSTAPGITASNGNAIVSITTNSAYQILNASVYALGANLSASGSLVLWLPMFSGVRGMTSNTLPDLSGNGNNGIIATNSGTVSSIKWSPMQKNVTNILTGQFNGQSSGIAIQNPSALPKGSISVAAWVYPKTSGYIETIYNSNPQSSTAGFSWVYIMTTGSVQEQYSTGSTYTSVQTGSSAVKYNQWNFIVAQFNTTSGIGTIYINGTLTANTALGGFAQTARTTGYIGDYNGSYYFFNGIIANVQIYNASLSQAQVSSLYAQGIAAMPLPSVPLTAWWPLNGNANDYSVNANNGNAVSVSFNSMMISSNSTISTPNMTGGYGSYASKISYSRLGVSPSTLAGVNFSVNQWFMVPNSVVQYPIVDIYNGIINSGIGGGQNFDFAGSWAGGPKSNFTWMEYSPVSAQKCNTSSGAIMPGAWYDALVSVNGYTGITIYLNGQEVASCTFTASAGTLSSYATNLMLGVNDNPQAGKVGSAYVSEVEVYNTSLSRQQAQELYNFGLPLYKLLRLP